MKKIIAAIICIGVTLGAFSQQQTAEQRKDNKRNAKKEKMITLMRQEEEGVPSFHKQNAFGIKLNTDGWGISYELGRANSVTRATIFQVEFNEKKHRKEQKDNRQTNAGNFIFFGNPFVYGKRNIFYQLKLAAGQQILVGGKSNKNGVSVYGIGAGGLSLGLLRPYYVEVQDQLNENRYVKYDSPDSLLFLTSGSIIGGAGLAKGWNEMKLAPGLHAKTALRFDYNRFNTIISAIEGGINVEYYFKEIEQMAYNPSRKFFVNAYISFLFGKRK
ncbi:hypothetical protein [Agriterribacter sp.]|uniref:hypothetical protein n=1 Tax=Agriterribacter sp. TaxID=2821509 RepID=UPI002CE0C0B5|nr:hypothetical protein [Agriterribacter sp.]HTN07904.1 hypothetical protein [Agriterribacter sp.]